MSEDPVLPDYDSVSIPSERTMPAGGPALGRVDHYDLLRKLGGGGFGVVYLARDTASGVDVALKTLHPLLKHNAEEMGLLREKFALVSRLAHPNIATALVLHPVREANVWDETARRELKLSPGDSVMVMRYAPGVTLSRWRRQFPGGAVPPELALEVGRQLAAALDYAHGERIVHRDIKPGNVMVETLGGASSPSEPTIRVRILDFGLAAEIRSSMSRVSTEQGDTSGTRPYMAPEQWLGRKQDGRTDQYALACVLYELLSGAPPFAGVFETGDPMIMMATVKGEAPDEIEGAAPAANAALLRALAKAPKDRFPSCTAFVAALSSAAERTEGTERETPPEAPAGAHTPGAPQGDAALEADVLRRKVALARALAALSAKDRADAELSAFVSDADIEADAVQEAIDRNRFAAAAACLDRADAALERLRGTKERRRADAERRAASEPAPGTVKTIEIAPGVPMELCWCPPTTGEAWRKASGGDAFFWMGSPDDEPGRDRDERRHRVTLTKGFWMGRTPVTQAQWEAVMGGNPSLYLDGRNFFGFGGRTSPQRPVDSVAWVDCREFLGRLAGRAPAGWRFALPTEAQWEYACRAGTKGPYAGGGRLDDMGWYIGNIGQETQPVRQKKPNAWGLFDMHGNIYEWCADWHGPYPGDSATDPTGPSSGVRRVHRGGAWNGDARHCRSAYRNYDDPACRFANVGFRAALVPIQ